MEGFSQAEIAERLDLSQMHISRLLARSIRKIKNRDEKTMSKTLNQTEIKDRLIHRYENLLLDEVTIINPETFEANLNLIDEYDHLDRTIFLEKSRLITHVFYPAPIFMEILALSSIVSSGKLEEGEAAIFASINQFKNLETALKALLLLEKLKKISAKGPFLKYGGSLTVNNKKVCEGTMTAFFNTIDFSPSKDTENISIKNTINIPTNKVNQHKPDAMIISDYLQMASENSLTSRYTYPKTHP